MTKSAIAFEYNFGEKPLFEDLKEIWFNINNESKYHDVKYIPLYKKLQLSLLAFLHHPFMSFFLFITISILLFNSNLGMHTVDTNSYNNSSVLYRNMFGKIKITRDNFIEKNDSIFYSYAHYHIDKFDTPITPLSFKKDGTAIIRVRNRIDCVINKQGNIVEIRKNDYKNTIYVNQ